MSFRYPEFNNTMKHETIKLHTNSSSIIIEYIRLRHTAFAKALIHKFIPYTLRKAIVRYAHELIVQNVSIAHIGGSETR